jgi:diguanylate cyclase (GGDEF)-like protein
MRLTPRSMRAQIAMFFIAMLASVQWLTHWTVNDANSRIAAGHLNSELEHGTKVLRRLIDDRGAQLLQAVQVLVADFAFRKTIASGDAATIQSALANHGARLKADIGFVVSDSKQITTSFGLPETLSTSALEALAKDFDSRKDHTRIVPIGGRLIQFAFAPVMMPDPNGWAVYGFALDARVANDLKELTGLEVSFLNATTKGEGRLSASTLSAPQRSALLLGNLDEARDTSELAGETFATARVALQPDDGMLAIALVQKSAEETIAPFKKLSTILTVVSLVGLLTSVLAGMWVARAIARPIALLTQAADRIRRGEHRVHVPTDLRGEIGQLASGFRRMGEEIEQREKEISQLAFIDPLTHLANRAGLLRAASLAQTATTDTACVVIATLNIARLRHINDGLGYSVGDRLIQAVAARLQAAANAREIIARTDGDRFAWLMRERNAEAAEARLRALLDGLTAMPITIDEQAIDVQLHIGWAVSRMEHNDSNALFRCAEIALDHASAQKTSPLRYDTAMAKESAPMLGLLSEIRRGIAEGEFVLHYQPKLSIDGQPRGVEALVRWNHPTRGLLGPGAFIEFAENTGNVRGITRAVLKQAIAQTTAWVESGYTIPVAVNISAHDVLDETFPDFVNGLLAQAGAHPELIKFEVTERALFDQFELADRALHKFNDTGIEIALDDYGTGYATLTHLSKLRVHELKIDRSFIMGLMPDSRNFAIVNTMIDLAHRLGMRAVAEGIETAEELNALRKTACDEVQGYHFAKPMPAAALLSWWHTRERAYAAIQRAAGLPVVPNIVNEKR